MSQEMHSIVEDVIKVSGSSNPQSVGSILARSVTAGHNPKMRAIGASAVNQAAKAAAIARGFVAPRGIDLSFIIVNCRAFTVNAFIMAKLAQLIQCLISFL